MLISLVDEVRVGNHPLQRAFQFTHVGADALGNEEGSIVRQIDLGLLGLLHQDRHTGLQLRRLHRHRQAPAETRLQALFKAFDLLGVAVAGENHLLAALKQGVEGVEELFLGTLLAGKELDVVDQQRIHRAVEALELVDRVELQRLDHVGDEAPP